MLLRGDHSTPSQNTRNHHVAKGNERTDREDEGINPNKSEKSAEKYSVGYGRPPKHSQFKKGMSGNKLGRPRKILSSDDMLGKLLFSKRPVTIDGTTVALTGLEILYKQKFNMAVKGNTKLLMALIKAGEDLIRKLRKSSASAEQSSFRTYTREELAQMTPQQLSDLYRETLAEENRIEGVRRGQKG